jgi:S-adenosylmethionine synthetase
MKVTKFQLKEIIKEEIYKILKEDKKYTVEYWYRMGDDEKEVDEIIVMASSEEDAIEKAKQEARRNSIKSSFEIIK